MQFQSTHPVRGATLQEQADAKKQEDISIHAPRAGCDPKPCRGSSGARNFNPRTPCGVRRGAAHLISGVGAFQSTHPVRGATRPGEDFLLLRKFQSTHPVRGATPPEYDRP